MLLCLSVVLGCLVLLTISWMIKVMYIYHLVVQLEQIMYKSREGRRYPSHNEMSPFSPSPSHLFILYRSVSTEAGQLSEGGRKERELTGWKRDEVCDKVDSEPSQNARHSVHLRPRHVRPETGNKTMNWKL